MPVITERSNVTKPILNTVRIGHGTLACIDLARTRRWYEEVLGFQVVQTSPMSMMICKGTGHIYAVVEARKPEEEMDPLNHNGLDVETREDVDAAYETLTRIKEEWGIREIRKPGIVHGDYCFYFVDLDGNWWEIVYVRKGGGHRLDIGDPEWDLTGHQEFLSDKGVRAHTHDPDFRARLKQKLDAAKKG